MPPAGAAPAGAREERVPPHSVEAERGLLGSALQDAARILDLCGERRVDADAFYVPAHQALFAALSEMAERHKVIDLLTVPEFLRETGRLDLVGGLDYLRQLVDITPTIEHAEYYAGLVHDKFILRTLLGRAREAAEACFSPDLEVEDLLSRVEQSILDVGNLRLSPSAHWDQVVKQVMADIERMIANPKSLTGLSTGFRDLDRITLGLQPGELIILAARPSMGKTALAMNIAENVANGRNPHSGYPNEGEGDTAGQPVAVFSLEMSREALARRMICSRAKVSWNRIAGGWAAREQRTSLMDAVGALFKAPIHIDDTPGMEVLELRARARRLRKVHNVALIVVDYLQMLNYSKRARDGRQQEVSAISGALKGMAKELKIPVLVLSQLNRKPEEGGGGVPKLADLRDSGSIEQDADVVMMLRRPCRLRGSQSSDDRTLAIVDVAKQRNGRTGEVNMSFDEDHTLFGDRARDAGEESLSPSSGGAPE